MAMGNVSREDMARQAEEQMKLFDYAENPIREWFMRFFDMDENELFGDVTGKSDVIVFEENKKRYIACLKVSDNQTDPLYDVNYWKSLNSENYGRGIQTLIRAVMIVFPCIKSTVAKKNIRGLDISEFSLNFDKQNVSFYFKLFYKEVQEYYKIQNQIAEKQQIMIKMMSEGKDPSGTELYKDLKTLLEKYNSIDKKYIEDAEKRMEEHNNMFIAKPRLYVHIYETEKIHDRELIMKRLPMIGMPYQDIDEPNEKPENQADDICADNELNMD